MTGNTTNSGQSRRIFKRGDILVPKTGHETWSVVACDQFTSEPEYWQQVESIVGDRPSALRLILPEAWLKQDRKTDIEGEMQRYLDQDVFRTLPQSLVYVERTLSGGGVRRGLVGVLDLEAYDYAPVSDAPVRATEGTVEERLPARVRLRVAAELEMPHIIVFIDDPQDTVMRTAAELAGEKLYDFELMQGGGRLAGRRISGPAAERVEAAVEALDDGEKPFVFAIGDGNHSLAAAKLCWQELKKGLTPEQALFHPARYSLVELENIHDGQVRFEPIHRVVFDTDTAGFGDSAGHFLKAADCGGQTHEAVILCEGEERRESVRGPSIGEFIGLVERFCRDWCESHGGRLDYIHGDDTARGMCSMPGACGILLPAMDKAELFSSIGRSGVFPRKSFSIGHAADKRYYMECRRIK